MALLPWQVHPTLWNVAFGLCIVGNILWFTAKFVLRSYGFPVSFIWHRADIPNLFRLVQRETNSPQHYFHIVLLASLCMVIAAFLASAFILLFSAA